MRDRPGDGADTGPAASGLQTPAASCPTAPRTATAAPGTQDRHRRLQTWLDALPEGAADAVLMAPADAARYSAQWQAIEGAWTDPLSDVVGDPEAVRGAIEDRMRWLDAQVQAGTYVEGVAGDFARALSVVGSAEAIDEVRVMADEAPLFCAPLSTGLFKSPIDPDFDRNRCASLHPGELVRVARHDTQTDWWRVHAGHTAGWVHAPTWTPALSREETAQRYGRTVSARTDAATTDGGMPIRLGVRLPVLGEGERAGTVRVSVPTAEGWAEDTVAVGGDVLEPATVPVTRRAVWAAALSELDAPYGWGGRAGERDCSRLLRDVFASFGVQLPRHSGVQALVGTRNVDVSAMSEADKRDEIRRAAARGLVLLYMPGHIMLYLGEDGPNMYAVSSVSEFLTPCEGGPDTVHRLDRVAVTTLDIGRGTERTAFIERITRLVLFEPGAAPSDAAPTSPTSQ